MNSIAKLLRNSEKFSGDVPPNPCWSLFGVLCTPRSLLIPLFKNPGYAPVCGYDINISIELFTISLHIYFATY